MRPARVADAAAILAIYAPAVFASVISFEEELPSVDQLAARMSARPAMPWLVVEIDGEVAGYATMYAGITLPNDSSVGLHERFGFTGVGVYRSVGFKHGRWLDVGWWPLPLVAELPAHPAEPAEWKGDLPVAPEGGKRVTDRRD